jgi:hypothetical protein
MENFSRVMVVVLFLSSAAFGHADQAARVIATGDWSKAVKDNADYALRGRLVLGERRIVVGGRERYEIITYIELQDASEASGRSMRVFCDLGKTDFRPENNSGLKFELLDKDNHPVSSPHYAFSGGAPSSQWITLPADATIRLRTSPFGVTDATGLAIAPDMSNLWVLQSHDSTEYSLEATFTVDLSKIVGPENTSTNDHVWHGTIMLPPLRVSGRALTTAAQAAPATTQASMKPDPIDALVAELATTHGMWENGAFQPIKLPADASAEQVLDKVFKSTTPQDGKRIKRYKVIEQRKIAISSLTGIEESPNFKAVRLDTDHGPRIVLLRYLQSDGWWSRSFDEP